MEPITAIATGFAALRSGVTLLDRAVKARQAGFDAQALMRLALLEARRNASILDVAIHRKAVLPTAQLWAVALELQTGALEALLGGGAEAARALKALAEVEAGDRTRFVREDAESIYVRIQTLQALAAINRKATLERVALNVRLDNIGVDLLRFIRAATGDQPRRARAKTRQRPSAGTPSAATGA